MSDDRAVTYLDLVDLLRIAERLLGGPPEVRDAGLLEAALARPRATVFGDEAYPGLDGKAAALLSSLVRNHALVDGNKRLGWAAVRVFLILNGSDLRAPHDDAYELVVAVAAGETVDVVDIAARLRLWMS